MNQIVDIHGYSWNQCPLFVVYAIQKESGLKMLLLCVKRSCRDLIKPSWDPQGEARSPIRDSIAKERDIWNTLLCLLRSHKNNILTSGDKKKRIIPDELHGGVLIKPFFHVLIYLSCLAKCCNTALLFSLKLFMDEETSPDLWRLNDWVFVFGKSATRYVVDSQPSTGLEFSLMSINVDKTLNSSDDTFWSSIENFLFQAHIEWECPQM